MPRNLPGTIKREAPPGPEMTEDQFKTAMEDLTHDAARWRWLRSHLSTVLEWPVEDMTAAEFREAIDAARRA